MADPRDPVIATVPEGSGRRVVVYDSVLDIAKQYNCKKPKSSQSANAIPQPSHKSNGISGLQADDMSINCVLKETRKRKLMKVDLKFEGCGSSVQNNPKKKKRTRRLDEGKVLKPVVDDSLKTTQETFYSAEEQEDEEEEEDEQDEQPEEDEGEDEEGEEEEGQDPQKSGGEKMQSDSETDTVHSSDVEKYKARRKGTDSETDSEGDQKSDSEQSDGEDEPTIVDDKGKGKKALESESDSKHVTDEDGMKKALVNPPLPEKISYKDGNKTLVMSQPTPLKMVVAKKTKYVFDPKKPFSTTCSPGKILRLVENLTVEQLKLVEEIGFGGLLKICCEVLPKELAHDLVLQFNIINSFIEVGADKMVLRPDDVFDVLGLPIGGEQVKEVSKAGKGVRVDETVRNKWKEEFGVDGSGYISCEKLSDKMTSRGINNKVCLGADFKKYFVMFVVSSFLNPHARSAVDFKLVDALEDINKIPKYDWCRYVFEKFVKSVKSFKTTTFSAVNGCLLVPLISFLHRYPLRGEPLPCSIPLLMHWETKNLVRTCELIRSAGFNSLLKSSQIFPLTSRGKLLDSGSSFGKMYARKSSSTSRVEPSTSRILNFEIPDDLLSDCQIENLTNGDVPRAISLQFHRNVEIMARVYLADMQQHLLSGDLAGKDRDVVATASKNYFSNPNTVQEVGGTVKAVMSKYATGSVPFCRSPRI